MGGGAERAGRPGRPRSEDARVAVLQAVDDLLVDVGYAAMTMKGIAERAGVGRQTVYRWWSTKAEILLEAVTEDAEAELAGPAVADDPAADLTAHLRALTAFLTSAPAGLAYRALLGEGQHDPVVGGLLGHADPLRAPTEAVLARLRTSCPGMPPAPLAAAQTVGPVLAPLLAAAAPLADDLLRTHAELLLRAWGQRG